MPGATEAELADAVEDLLTRAGQGPGGVPAAASAKRERRVAARTRAASPSVPPGPEPRRQSRRPENLNGEAATGRPSSRCRSSTRSARRRNGGDPARRGAAPIPRSS